MLSYQVTEFGGDLAANTSETPTPTGTEVLLRITACGVCHSDIHIWHGGYDLGGNKFLSLQDRGIGLPLTMGHEPIGEVVAVGPDAKGVSVGDTRLAFPWIGCGTCQRCRDGQDNDCTAMRTLGVFWPGGFADHLLVPHPKYLLDIGDIPQAYASTLACAGITAFSALSKTLPLAIDDKVVLIGAGGVGLTGVGMAGGYLEREIISVDIDDEKLAAARAAGADHTVNSSDGKAVEHIADLTGGGPGAVVDFVGSSETARLGFDVVRKGGTYVGVGLYGGDVTLSTALLPLRHVSVRGSYVGRLDEMQSLLAFVRSGKVKPVPVATRPLDQVTQTLKDLEAGRIVGRVVVQP